MGTGAGRREKKGARIPEVSPTAALATPPTGKELVPRYTTWPAGRQSKKPARIFRGPISVICEKIAGGKKTFMDLARLAPEIEPELKRIIIEWDRFRPFERQEKNIDQLCRLKGVDPIHFLAVVGEAAMKFRDNAQIIIAALNTPAVVDRLCKEAVKPDRPEYTKMFLQHTGFLPRPKGAEIRVNQFSAQQVNTKVEGNFPTVESAIFETDHIVRPKSEKS